LGFGVAVAKDREKGGGNEKRPRVMLDRQALTGSREFSLFEIQLPRQDFPEAGITGFYEGDGKNTTKSTTWASSCAECIRQHLDDEQFVDLLSHLVVGALDLGANGANRIECER
jgi:hypothetical protein